MQNIPVTMIRPDTANLPHIDLPRGYAIKNYQDGDREKWAAIEYAAGEFGTVDEAINRFNDEFLPHEHELRSRMLFLVDQSVNYIGTGTAWYNRHFHGEDYGRLHWIAIHPSFQGKKLGKPLVCAVMKILACHHKKIYLTTQTTSYKAVNMYLRFGFQPVIEHEQDKRAWALLAEKLNNAQIERFLL